MNTTDLFLSNNICMQIGTSRAADAGGEQATIPINVQSSGG